MAKRRSVKKKELTHADIDKIFHEYYFGWPNGKFIVDYLNGNRRPTIKEMFSGR